MNRKMTTILMTLSLALGLTSWRAFRSQAASGHTGAGQQVGEPFRLPAIAAGGDHSLALKSDGTVVAWGGNSFGQRNMPAGLSGVTAIAAGGNHSLALRVTNAPTNTPPTVSGATLTRTAGSPLANATIATVNDTGSSAAGVTVAVDGGSSATSNNVTVANLVNTNGTITADIVAACGATNASFTLTATDGWC